MTDYIEESVSFDSKNNNIVFKSSENLKIIYENVKKNKQTEINLLKKYYEKGFLPLTLIDNVTDQEKESFLRKRHEKYKFSKSLNKNDDYLIEGELINNDNFASLLSDKGEIQVGDSIYRYTKRGLFIVHKDKRVLLDNQSKTNNNDITTYVPDKNQLLDFTIVEVDECNNPIISEDYLTIYDEFCSNCSSGSGGTGVSTSTLPIPVTTNYNVCVNSKAGWIDNIFGKSYVCEYFFDSNHKLRTIFEVADFYFFQDVYSQAKFKEKSWTGWWFSDRTANEVYILNKKVILKTDRRDFGTPTIYVNELQIQKIFQELSAFFTSEPDKTVSYISNEYDFDNKVTNIYHPTPAELTNAALNGVFLVPNHKINKPFLDIDVDLKDFFGKKVNNAFVVNIIGKKVFSMSNTDLIKTAFELLSNKKVKLDPNKVGGIVIMAQDLTTKGVRPLVYSIFGEKVTVNNLAVAARDFNVPTNYKLDKIVLGYRYNVAANGAVSEDYGLGFNISWDVVNSVDIEIESGAYYNGKWGGSKFKVQY